MSTTSRCFHSLFWEVPRITITHFGYNILSSLYCILKFFLDLMKISSMMKMLTLITSTVFLSLSVRMISLIDVNSVVMISFCLVLDSTIPSWNVQITTSGVMKRVVFSDTLTLENASHTFQTILELTHGSLIDH